MKITKQITDLSIALLIIGNDYVERWFLYMFKNIRSFIQRRRKKVRIAKRNKHGYYELEDVVQWFLSKGPMSPKKLQKLLYYAYSWTLTLTNESIKDLRNKLFEESFEAWVHGPVLPEVYQQFKHYGYADIVLDEVEDIKFDKDIDNILSQVWDVYGGYSGNELESITHQEKPWLRARNGLPGLEPSRNKISDVDIFSYYLNEMMQGNN